MVQSGQFLCGPLALSLNAPRGALLDKFVDTLGLYDVVWEASHLAVKIDVVRAGAPAPMAAGTFLECARMKVDAAPPGLRATCPSGVAACYNESENSWVIAAPAGFDVSERPEDIEDLLSLVLTTG